MDFWNQQAFFEARRRQISLAAEPLQSLERELAELERRSRPIAMFVVKMSIMAELEENEKNDVILAILAFIAALPAERVAENALSAAESELKTSPITFRNREIAIITAAAPRLYCNLELDITLLQASKTISPLGARTIHDSILAIASAIRRSEQN